MQKILNWFKQKNVTSQTLLKALSVIIAFACFTIIVKPRVSEIIVPMVINEIEKDSEYKKGLDLDPIISKYSVGTEVKASSLYATGYVFEYEMYGSLVISDTRVTALGRFLEDYGSPMAPSAQTFVDVADETGMDWRLIASISGVESSFGRIIPYNSYNAWGWKGGPGGSFSVFASWDDAISQITRRMATGYGTNIDPYAIEGIYCPPCGQTGTHTWAGGVSRFMMQIDEYRKNL